MESYTRARAQFKYFGKRDLIFMENAGGSQVPICVATAVADHLMHDCAQLGAGYPQSARSTQVVADAHTFMKTFMNVHGSGEVMLGTASSNLFQQLSDCYRRSGHVKAGDEIIIHEASHEANAGPWTRLAEDTGAALKIWPVGPAPTFSSSITDLQALLSLRTKIVAAVHVSNLLGEVLDVPAMVQAVHAQAPNAHTVVDGVAYAPHIAIDAAAWGVDWYGLSMYKTWGPHLAALYGRTAALQAVIPGGLNHYFVPSSAPVYKFELGGPSHEACAGVLAIGQYLQTMAGEEASGGELKRSTLERAFATFVQMEWPLLQALLTFLRTLPDVQVCGLVDGSLATRVPTISFVSRSQTSEAVARQLQDKGVACRHGHCYAHRLVMAMVAASPKVRPDWSVEDGVVRISMLHYNTPEEVDHVIQALGEVLS